MIKCHLSRLMGENKLNVVKVEKATGLHRNTITLLYKETAHRVDFATMEKLCRLFKCQISDLFELKDDDLSKK